jgi:hypothetical protein
MNLVNNSLIIILPGGELLFSSNGSKELFNQVLSCETIEEVKYLMVPELSKEEKVFQEEVKKNEDLKKKLVLINNTPDFELRDGAVYMKGTSISLPKILVEEILNKPDSYHALKNFWTLALLNPNSLAREGLFDFLRRGNFTITPSGMVLAYRCVLSVGPKNKKLVEFISNQYAKIRLRKKATSDYWVHKDNNDNYSLHKADTVLNASLVGNLKDLYLNLPDLEENKYTDQYTKTFDIRIGKEVSMDRKLTDESGASCSRGLHLASNLSDYAHFGDTKLLVAFSPRNVVSVPESETTKMRVCAYMPIAVLTNDDWNILDDLETVVAIDDYAVEEIDNIEEMLANTNVQELKKHYMISDLKQPVINKLILDLENIKNEISSRIIQVS